MTALTYEAAGGVGVLRLDDGKANAIGPDWLREAAALLDTAEADATRALVVVGRERFFSAGLDLHVVPTLAPEAQRAVAFAFVDLACRVFLWPKPVVAASAGHALAGGFMLFCAADVRLAVDDPRSRYGLTELAVGVPVIGPTAAIVAAAVPSHERPALLLHGRQLGAREAAALGVVHELVDDGTALLLRAAARARAIASAVEPTAYRISKLALRRPLVDAAAATATALAPLLPAGGDVVGRRPG